MAEVRTSSAVRQNGGNEQALVDFDTAAVALKASVFGGDVLRAWNQTRHDGRCRGDQFVNARTAGQPIGQDVVDGLNMSMQKAGARPAGGFMDYRGGGALWFVAVCSGWQLRDQSG
jgi:hypothetical protein